MARWWSSSYSCKMIKINKKIIACNWKKTYKAKPYILERKYEYIGALAVLD